MATTTRPLQIGVSELRTRPGTRRRVERSIPSEGLSTSSASVPAGAEVQLEVEVEAISGGVVAEGTVRAPWVGACRRCLEPVEGVAEVGVREVFEDRPTEGETYPLRDDVIDLAPMVHDALLLALPLAPLCQEDCRGPAPEAFPTGVDPELADVDTGPTDPADPPGDPRWAALDDLRFD